MDETYTRANEQLAEFRVLLDLTTERLWDLQRDFAVLQNEMVKACAMLGSLPDRWNYSHVRNSHLPISGAISPRHIPHPASRKRGQGL